MATTIEASSASQFWTAIVAGDATSAEATGNGLTNVPLVGAPRFELTYSPLLGVLSSTGAAATISAGVVGESEDPSPLPVQPNTPQVEFSGWNENTKFQLMVVPNSSIV